MSEGEVKIDIEDRQNNCQVCFEDKSVKYFYTFRCGHSVCKNCYKKIKDKYRCYYCRQELMDEKIVKMYKKSLLMLILMMMFDTIYTASLFIITNVSSKIVIILVYVDTINLLILLIMMIYRLDGPSIVSNILTCILKIVWIIMLFIINVVWLKGELFILSKIG